MLKMSFLVLGGSFMADFSKFRTSIGGFNRSDVSDYMTKVAAEHQAILKQNQKETAELQQRLRETEFSLDDALTQLNKAKADLEACTAENASLRAELEAAEALLASQPAPQEPAPDYASMELEAYRRAEATERLASERSAKLRQQITDLLETSADRYEESGQEITALAEDIRANLKRLEESLSDLEVLFGDTADGLRKLDEEEAVTC
jgi:DNA repair exonuclease SbcCD ATPase subunit